jgi:putative hydrolase of the HAD superfamily
MRRQAEERRLERALLIDADDTLWENNIFYLRCLARFQDYMASFGCDREAAAAMLDRAERETIPTMGYGPDGYVAALGVACERLLSNGSAVPPGAVEGARALGELVLNMPMIVIPGVETTLTALRSSSELVLVTKGDPRVQRDKLERSGLAPHFDAVYVVAEKNAAVYRRIAAERGLRPGYTWMVGNSPKSDINPAIEAGLGAILVPHNHTWTAEVQQIGRPDLVVTLERFADLLPFFGVE